MTILLCVLTSSWWPWTSACADRLWTCTPRVNILLGEFTLTPLISCVICMQQAQFRVLLILLVERLQWIMAVRCWYMLALLVLAVSWRSQGAHNFINKHDNRRGMRRLRYLHDKDQPGLIMGQQKHSLMEEIAQQVSHGAVLLPLSLSLSLSSPPPHTYTP